MWTNHCSVSREAVLRGSLLTQPRGFKGVGVVPISPHPHDPLAAHRPYARESLVYDETTLPTSSAHPDAGNHLVTGLDQVLDLEVDPLERFEPGHPRVSNLLEPTPRPPVASHSMSASYSLRNACQSRRCCASTTARTTFAFSCDIARAVSRSLSLPRVKGVAAPLAAAHVDTEDESRVRVRLLEQAGVLVAFSVLSARSRSPPRPRDKHRP
jgi:hypothetical protein